MKRLVCQILSISVVAVFFAQNFASADVLEYCFDKKEEAYPTCSSESDLPLEAIAKNKDEKVGLKDSEAASYKKKFKKFKKLSIENSEEKKPGYLGFFTRIGRSFLRFIRVTCYCYTAIMAVVFGLIFWRPYDYSSIFMASGVLAYCCYGINGVFHPEQDFFVS